MYKFCDISKTDRLNIFTTPDSPGVKISNLVQQEIDNFVLFDSLNHPDDTARIIKYMTTTVRNIVVLGCGGTGSWLIPKIVKTMNDLHRKNILRDKPKLILVDGDTVEPKNLIRQNFIESDIGSNKAVAMAMRYGPHLKSDIEVVYFDKYITNKKNLYAGVDSDKFMNINILVGLMTQSNNGGDTIIFNLVDNQNARRVLHGSIGKYIVSNRLNRSDRFIIVDVGNEDTYGQLYATMYETIGRKYILTKDTFFDFSPETIDKEEEVSIYSCAEADVDIEKEDQFLIANDTAANVAHNWLASYFSSPYMIPQLIRFTCIPTPYVKVEKYMLKGYFNHFVLELIDHLVNTRKNIDTPKDTNIEKLSDQLKAHEIFDRWRYGSIVYQHWLRLYSHMCNNQEFISTIKHFVHNYS